MANRRHLDPTDSAAALYGFKLRELRDAKGWGQAHLAKAAFCSPELISKIETAAHPATLATSKLFDQIFGLCNPAMTFEELHHLVVRESTPEVVRSLADREASATVIRVFEPMVVTGLLQCDAYMRALMETGIERNTVDEAVATRMRRQSRVFGTVSPLLIVVFDEGVLRRCVGGPAVMKEQLDHLYELATKDPNVSIHIVPSRTASYAGLDGPIWLMSFDDEPDIAFSDGSSGTGRLIGDPKIVAKLTETFELIRNVALPVAESEQIIHDIQESL